MATVLSKLCKDHSSWLRVTPVFVTGFTKGVEYWEKDPGTGYHAFQFSAPMMVEYSQGIRTYEKQGPRTNIGLLWQTYVLRVFIIARADSGITNVEEFEAALRAGEKIAMGEAGSTSYIITKAWIEDGLGIPFGEYDAIHGRIMDVVTWYKEGIPMASWADVSAAGIPYPYVVDATTAIASNYMSVTQAQIDRMNEAIGSDTYVIAPIASGLYRGQPANVSWPGMVTFCSVPLGPHPQRSVHYDDIAYELCRLEWEYHDEGVEMALKFGLTSPALTKAALQKEWLLPFHPGALKYYKEIGWID
jgi:TRAP-type uncharacterized transport system substrate-binding protein